MSGASKHSVLMLISQALESILSIVLFSSNQNLCVLLLSLTCMQKKWRVEVLRKLVLKKIQERGQVISAERELSWESEMENRLLLATARSQFPLTVAQR